MSYDSLHGPPFTPDPKCILEHDQYLLAVRNWYKLRGEQPQSGGGAHFPGKEFSVFIGTDPEKTFSWVNYPLYHKIYVPAHCVERILLLLGPHAATIYKAYCIKHGLDLPTQAASAVV